MAPYLIDGNNLIYALADAGRELGREGLCKLLARLLDGRPVTTVFDGPPPPAQMVKQIEQTGVTVEYSSDRPADEVIIEHIQSNSAPRRLTVVSTDREIRQAARRRRCICKTSQEFATLLEELTNAPARRNRPEPPEKTDGLSGRHVDKWMKEFGYEE
ncbi:MAG: NYN domain-containing protein [Phycisphaerae bacterium]|jgi:hypothetical protein|nr:NYN domain-containing protein [Phycisphaerae bacterium]